MLIFKFNKFETSLLGKKAMRLINQVGFSDFFEESKSDDSYRNDPTVEGVSQINQIKKKLCKISCHIGQEMTHTLM